MKRIQYSLHREEPFWVAQCLNVDVSSFGNTPSEAVANLTEAMELFFEDGGTGYTEVQEVTIGEVTVHA